MEEEEDEEKVLGCLDVGFLVNIDNHLLTSLMVNALEHLAHV